MPARPHHAHTEEWQQVRQLCLWPEQRRYELVRPLVLFGDLSAERAQETETPERTLRHQAEEFTAGGMLSLFRPTRKQVEDHHRSLPPPMRQAIVDLKAEYPGLSLHELAQICYVRFGRRPSHHTVQLVLADGPRPTSTTRRYPRYSEITDSAARRHAVVALHAEGWTPTSIAGYLDLSRTTVYEVLRRWKEEGVDGLADKSHANTRPVRKVDLATKQAVYKLQENPELGAFRIHAALKQLGIHVSPATCGRLLAENRHLYGLGKPKQAPKEPREHPYKAQYRHHIWSVDVRYIEHHQIAILKGPFYIISILDNFSRAILASNVCQRQDETAYLLVLLAAILWLPNPAGDLRRRFFDAIYLPLVLLGARGMYEAIAGVRSLRARRLIPFSYVAFSAIGSAFLLLAPLPVAAEPQYTISNAEYQGLRWLSAEPTGRVLSMPGVGLYVPAYSADTVYVGHYDETYNYATKTQTTFNVLTGRSDIEEFIRENQIRYVVWTSDLPAPPPGALGRPAYDSPDFKIWRLF
jgi:transposase